MSLYSQDNTLPASIILAVGIALGLTGGGWLIGHLGFAAVFWVASACGVLALGCATRALRHGAGDVEAA